MEARWQEDRGDVSVISIVGLKMEKGGEGGHRRGGW